MSQSGTLVVISGPSGTGKSSLCRQLVDGVDSLSFSISYTTRERREGEVDGRDYHFVDRPRFESMIREGSLIEWADVFGQLYGTGREVTERELLSGGSVLLDIDVQGASQVRDTGLPHASIMLLPPSFGELEQRLRKRGSETEESIGRRLREARAEVAQSASFDYVVINRDLSVAVDELKTIVRAERLRQVARRSLVQEILGTFPEGHASADRG